MKEKDTIEIKERYISEEFSNRLLSQECIPISPIVTGKDGIYTITFAYKTKEE